MTSSNDDNKVGRGRPPKHSQFKPGRSGNPRGRPKGRHLLARIISKTLAERLAVDDRQKRVAVEAWVRMIRDRALRGDLKAAVLLRDLIKDVGLSAPEPIEEAPQQLTVDDHAIIDDFLHRLGREDQK